MASAAFDPGASDGDALTGLLAAASGRERLESWARDGLRWQAMLIGLQRFQAVNRAFGQPAGDAALGEVARRIRTFAGDAFAGDAFAGEWFAARIDGSAFLLAATGDWSRERWSFMADALAQAVARPLVVAGERVRLTTRIALLRALPGESPKGGIDSLSHALAEAQSQPAQRLIWADGTRMPRGRSGAALEGDLMRALGRGEIAVLFQPQFGLANGRPTGAEALARWDHPALGRIGAETLFAVAERSDQTAALGRHIAERALSAAVRWSPQADLRLSLNLTAAELASSSCVATLDEVTASSGFDPHRLTLEVTEQSLLVDLDAAAVTLRALAARGMRIALDDFGSGFANFRYLKLLPLDYLKLDHTLTDDIAADPRDRTILRAIVAMAKALDLEVIAEGVESEAQRALLAAEGCDYYQGFLRAGPMRADEFDRFIAES
ncbi:GGDEF domain-containing phosphodiesterase [Novosphingobium sp. Gsoil 351]|uniref:GGDEF domain-containing phosphodiesterase n=1 Tax=Novosphingobium sp. Gsoil 351 TaxID=2675225 RepID=UPI0012B4535F|nr:GGDEF domain-containing phosphodiesterase [Novosphingobium sp. Gsoil 351]QGN53441.1 EAL domain-containing protein [Novosphingobium sp. Gsoil 351]